MHETRFQTRLVECTVIIFGVTFAAFSCQCSTNFETPISMVMSINLWLVFGRLFLVAGEYGSSEALQSKREVRDLPLF